MLNAFTQMELSQLILFFHNKTSLIYFVLSFNGNQRSIKGLYLFCVVLGEADKRAMFAKLEEEMTT
jgi:hypothetical protein